MGTRQYVGARYVPKFADPVEWNGALSYEALTIVTHLGNSFTSKKPVPAGVDIGNTDYWVNTGNYNAQLEEYREQVQTSVDSVDKKLEYTSVRNFFGGKNILILGDSNSIEGESWRGTCWTTPFKQYLDGISNNIVNNSQSGRSFTLGETDRKTMPQVVDDLSATNEYDYIIVFCGVNDWSAQSPIGTANVYSNFNLSQFDDAVKYTFVQLKNKFPKAAQFWITPLVTNNYATKTTPLLVYANAIRTISTNGFTCIDGYLAPGYFVSGGSATQYSLDGLHTNDAYAPILARFIMNSMMSGGTAVCPTNFTMNLEMSDKFSSWFAALQVFSDGHVELTIKGSLLTTDYKGFLKEAPPSWAINEYNATVWYAYVEKTDSNAFIHIDTIDGNPYPTQGYNDVGDKYTIMLKLMPASMNETHY